MLSCIPFNYISTNWPGANKLEHIITVQLNNMQHFKALQHSTLTHASQKLI